MKNKKIEVKSNAIVELRNVKGLSLLLGTSYATFSIHNIIGYIRDNVSNEFPLFRSLILSSLFGICSLVMFDISQKSNYSLQKYDYYPKHFKYVKMPKRNVRRRTNKKI